MIRALVVCGSLVALSACASGGNTPDRALTTSPQASSPANSLPLFTEDLPPETLSTFSLGIHCGAAVLSLRINGQVWIAEEGIDQYDWLPAEWDTDPTRPDGPLQLELWLSADGETITATLNEREVIYTPVGTSFEDFLCD